MPEYIARRQPLLRWGALSGWRWGLLAEWPAGQRLRFAKRQVPGCSSHSGVGLTAFAVVSIFYKMYDPQSGELMLPMFTHGAIWAATGAEIGGLAFGLGVGGNGPYVRAALFGRACRCRNSDSDLRDSQCARLCV